MRTEDREGNRGREVGGAAVRLNSKKRENRGVIRRSRREWLRGERGRDDK